MKVRKKLVYEISEGEKVIDLWELGYFIVSSLLENLYAPYKRIEIGRERLKEMLENGEIGKEIYHKVKEEMKKDFGC